jgi:thiosulfate dehydrogenase
MGRILLGFVLGIILLPLGVMAWLRFGHPPVAVSDPPLPMERWITHIPLNERIDAEMVKTPPIQPDAEVFMAGAQIYSKDCAACHGFQGKPSTFGAHMFPRAPQLWQKHPRRDVVGVSDDPPGETAWKVDNGIRLSGMPSFKSVLNDTQIWQVSLLLANANKPLPPAVMAIVEGQTPSPAPAAPAKKKR